MTKGTSSAPFSAPTVVILGTDLLLTARPATPVQLAHACIAAGYSAALPASWGDELLASALAKRAAARSSSPVIACACPYVSDRFAGELDRFLLNVVSPPIATARYIRELYGGPVHITYVGACPGAHDRSIDALYTPGEFLARLRELGIEAEDQPVVFESVIPPDRRRFESLPGGIPTSDALQRAGAPHALLELEGDDYIISLAQQLFEREAVLIDVAPRLGCACAGAVNAGSLRAAVAALEPPRARTPVIEASLSIDVDAPARPSRLPLSHPAPPPPLPPPPISIPAPAVATSADLDSSMPAPSPTESSDESADVEEKEEPTVEPHVPLFARADLPDERVRHRSPAMGVPRVGSGMPVSRTQQGRIVPRAYLRRRRPWGDLDAPDASATSHREPDEPTTPSEPSTPTAPLADMPGEHAVVEHAPLEADGPAQIAKHVEIEVPLSRLGLPKMAACDLIPPPPIMPDLHLGDSLVVGDSLSDLIGFDVPLRKSAEPHHLPEIAEPELYTPSPIAAPATPAQEASASPGAPTAPAPRRDAPYSTPKAIDDLLLPRQRPAPPKPSLPLPPAVSAPRRESPASTPVVATVESAPVAAPAIALEAPPAPAPVATPAPKRVEKPVSVSRTVRERRPPVILPPRRRATTAMIWVLFGVLVALVAVSVKLLVTDRMATASPRSDSTRAGLADSLARDSAITPTLPPVIVDSVPAAESTATPAADSTATATPAAPDTARAQPAPPRRTPARVRPPARSTTRRAPATRPRRAPAPTTTTPQPTARPGAPTTPTTPTTPPRADSTPNNAVPNTDSAEINQPRVTRPWPPPAQ